MDFSDLDSCLRREMWQIGSLLCWRGLLRSRTKKQSRTL